MAPCAGVAPDGRAWVDVFFSGAGEDVARAKCVCAVCEGRAACLAGAIDRGEEYGVWGGVWGPGKAPRRRPQPTAVVEGVTVPVFVIYDHAPGVECRHCAGPVAQPSSPGRLKLFCKTSCQHRATDQRRRDRDLTAATGQGAVWVYSSTQPLEDQDVAA